MNNSKIVKFFSAIITVLIFTSLLTGCAIKPNYSKRDAWLLENPRTNLELFPVYGVTLGQTTTEELLQLGGTTSGQFKWEYFDYNNIDFWDFRKIGVINDMSLSVRYNDGFPLHWTNLGYNENASYDEWITFLLKNNYTVDLPQEPTCASKYKSGLKGGLEARIYAYKDNIQLDLFFASGGLCGTVDKNTLAIFKVIYLAQEDFKRKVSKASNQQIKLQAKYNPQPLQMAKQAYAAKQLNKCVKLCAHPSISATSEAKKLNNNCLNEIKKATPLLKKSKQQISRKRWNEAEQTLSSLQAKWSDNKEALDLQVMVKNEVNYATALKNAKASEAKKDYYQAIIFYETALKIHGNQEIKTSLASLKYNNNLEKGIAYQNNGLWKLAMGSFLAAKSHHATPEVNGLLNDARAMSNALDKRKTDMKRFLAALDAEKRKLNRYWSNKKEASWQRFLTNATGPGTHIDHEGPEIERNWADAEDALKRRIKRDIEQWDKDNPVPTLETVLTKKQVDTPTENINNSSIQQASPFNGSIPEYARSHYVDAKTMKIIKNKGEYADVTSDIPDIFYGKYVFVKDDTPGFNRTYQFNKDGTGSAEFAYPKSKKRMVSWGVLVESNNVYVKNISIYSSVNNNPPAMTIVYKFDDGSAGVNFFYMYDGNPAVLGPYQSVIKKSGR